MVPVPIKVNAKVLKRHSQPPTPGPNLFPISSPAICPCSNKSCVPRTRTSSLCFSDYMVSHTRNVLLKHLHLFKLHYKTDSKHLLGKLSRFPAVEHKLSSEAAATFSLILSVSLSKYLSSAISCSYFWTFLLSPTGLSLLPPNLTP